MFFDNLADMPKLAAMSGCVIFVIPDNVEIPIKNAILVEKPKDKASILIEQIRDVISRVNTKQSSDQYIIVRQAEKLNLEAANAFLKNLEEPKENYHFILQTTKPSNLLPTILSRAKLYFWRQKNPLDANIEADDKVKDLAKRLLVARERDYVEIMNDIVKKKDNTREYALEILSIAIEMAYKSYFKTKNVIFLKKLPKLIQAHANISANGNIKLHLVADML